MCWQQCPAEFYARYVAGHAEAPTEAMLFGSAIHLGLEAHFLGKDGEKVFRAAWKAAVQEPLSGAADPKLTGVGLTLLDGVFALGLSGTPEWTFRIATEDRWGAPTVGAVDLLDVDHQTIYDFKTTTGAWSQTRAERELWQPALYTLATTLAYDTWPIEFRYVVLNKVSGRVDVFVTRRGHDDLAELEERGTEISRRARQGDFACHGKHGACPECGATWEHVHACDLSAAPPRIRLNPSSAKETA